MSIRSLAAPVLVFGLLARFAGAQNPPPTSLPPCADTCVLQAVNSNSGCTSFTDVQCICTNPALVSMIGSCVMKSCAADVQQEALQFFDAECAPFTVTSTSGESSRTASASAG
ncbi:hypothetical protein GY45DRAFT_1259454 [Cubamyces sp. BRFM 1775]|nr:hypothetical protein GY45DRAFT_1259454 [Cubamyces sp. BRFM 1775]